MSKLSGKQAAEAIAKTFGVEVSNYRKTVNRAIRTLPGGGEALDALEALNAARRHAHRHGAADRVVSTDAALNRVEDIVAAMESYVISTIATETE